MIRAERLMDSPIICPDMDERMGSNINGPSLIRVPQWIENPLGRYYLYFADHKGTYMRMAYADDLKGPWQTHPIGVLDVQNSFFETVDLQQQPSSGSTDHPEHASDMFLYAHIASPDVHVDAKSQKIRMYYHGLLANGDQMTRIACSHDGLSFTAMPQLLGPPYFRAISHQEHIYVISWGGQFLRSHSWDGPFETGPLLPGISSKRYPNRILRHAALLVRKAKLHVFYSCIGDFPESIMHTELSLCEDWQSWEAEAETLLLAPSLDWEGVDLPVTRSAMGAADTRLRELRDPCIFEENGRTYLLYCGAGEAGIGLAEVIIS